MKTSCFPNSSDSRIFERTQCFPVPQPRPKPVPDIERGSGTSAPDPRNRPVDTSGRGRPEARNRPVDTSATGEQRSQPAGFPGRPDAAEQSEELENEGFPPEIAEEMAEQLARLAETFGEEPSQEPEYVEVTIEPWGTGHNDCIYNVLTGLGYTHEEIVEGNLIQEVADLNDIENPDLVHPGQVIKVPVRQADGPQAEETGVEETQETEESDGGSRTR